MGSSHIPLNHAQKKAFLFALVKKQQSGVMSLGFAQMPRVTYGNSTHEMVKNLNPAHVSMHILMAELIFGTMRDEGLSLKSR